ncbi:MAG: antitoxin MazE family protein [Siculibacillus sp.]|nr:antitoxin MazE family protein [Siculibacillus sp.]
MFKSARPPLRVRKRRDALRAAGLRPVQIWVPDARRPGFAEECLRQSRVVAMADAADREMDGFLDAALADLADQTTP